MTTIRIFLLVVVTLALLLPANALACACCSNPGHYFSGMQDLDEYPLSQMKRMRFGRTASLFATEAGIEEDARGITRPKSAYSVQGSMAGNSWRLTFRSGASSGMLNLQLPAKMWDHSADIHDGKISAGGGPSLYKEWRFEGDVTGTGIFQPGFASPAKYVLVLQGRGNGCDNAEDFTHWRLEVKGEAARYAFHGRFARPVAQSR